MVAVCLAVGDRAGREGHLVWRWLAVGFQSLCILKKLFLWKGAQGQDVRLEVGCSEPSAQENSSALNISLSSKMRVSEWKDGSVKCCS